MGAQGTATLNFGAFPGASDASIAVTGQTSIVSGSLVEAWILPAATADHSSDEHLLETFKVLAGNIVAGTGFTIYGINTSETFELAPDQSDLGAGNNVTYAPGGATLTGGYSGPPVIGRGTRIYGAWSVAWVWN